MEDKVRGDWIIKKFCYQGYKHKRNKTVYNTKTVYWKTQKKRF